VVTAQAVKPSTLIFDEVDVGIGGETGDVVGRLLRQLGESGQVLCVTHLAQVASKAHQHLKVSKNLLNQGAYSDIAPLLGEEKVAEIARMMGGQVQSAQSLAHAREMLERL
ncbi:MAG TPA: DNA repair protein RecN, partial [Cellvibrionaceae bacterium]|nr:DNA repair protein RecN [Cellvibrionaceae bacterium]